MANETKSYFQQKGTVISWWYPESEREPLHEHYEEQLRWVLAQANWQGARVADIGTGKGRFAIACARQGAKVYALDIAPEMLDEAGRAAKRAGARVRFVRGDAENLPYPDRFFDIVLCMETIMHVPHPEQLVREVARIVRPGGLVIMSMTNKYRINALLRLPEVLYRRLRPAKSEAPRYMWSYSVPQFRRFLHQAGLDIQTLHGQGLLQANARLRLGRKLSVAAFPRPFALWFFAKVEPPLRETFLRGVMGTVMAVARPTPTSPAKR